MLVSYQQTTRRLLADVTFAQFNDFDLRDWINIARSQIAGEGEAIRTTGTIPTVIGTARYQFSGITLAGTGLSATLAVRMLSLGSTFLTPRQWEWMFEYYVAPAVGNGVPVDWGQLGQGTTGSLYIGPPPAAVGTITVDVVATPAALSSDADVEALPWPFQDAVPYYAAYMALLTQQNFDAAERFFQLYERFVARARAIGTPTVLPEQYLGSDGSRMASRSATLTPSMAPAPSRSGGGG